MSDDSINQGAGFCVDRIRWHGDIKPENILRVKDRFKLADHGEARIQLATGSERPKTKIGGTRTYCTSVVQIVPYLTTS